MPIDWLKCDWENTSEVIWNKESSLHWGSVGVAGKTLINASQLRMKIDWFALRIPCNLFSITVSILDATQRSLFLSGFELRVGCPYRTVEWWWNTISLSTWLPTVPGVIFWQSDNDVTKTEKMLVGRSLPIHSDMFNSPTRSRIRWVHSRVPGKVVDQLWLTHLQHGRLHQRGWNRKCTTDCCIIHGRDYTEFLRNSKLWLWNRSQCANHTK